MKTIGLLGGTAWVSTIDYYRQINKMVNERLGKNHSAKIILKSIDYEEIKKYNYQDWEKIGDVLMDELIDLDSCNIDCILICNNTLHKSLGQIESNLYLENPIFNIIECAGEYAKEQKIDEVLLLGTKFTMEDGFYQDKLKKYDIKVKIPDDDDRNEIQRIIQEELSKEKILDISKEKIKNIVEKNKCKAVIVGCTELPMIVRQDGFDIPILNTLELHCKKAVDFALN